jgi:hypothetical protein
MKTRTKIYEYQNEGINSLEKKAMIIVWMMSMSPKDKGCGM